MSFPRTPCRSWSTDPSPTTTSCAAAATISSSAALQGIGRAKTVRARHGETFVTDGPFAETKEQLLGFILIDARDLDEAVRLAAKIPMASVGTVEVRPVQELEPARTARSA